MILGGDIGGTHTRLALFEETANTRGHAERSFLNRDHASLIEIVTLYREEHKESIHKVCFGLAGPVHQGVCRITNLPWSLNVHELIHIFQIPHVYFLNDLQANAYGLRMLNETEFLLLQPGIQQPGNAALISAGTGLGEAGLYWDGKHHHPFASEGGHADFAPRTSDECALLLFLQKRMMHVSYERVISGPGLVAIYQFLIETQREQSRPEIQQALHAEDPARVISEWGIQHHDEGCLHALDWFLSLYGAEAGNMALKMLALGGVYLGGGMILHLLEPLQRGLFQRSFCNKGRFQQLLESIPIRVVLNAQTALLGTAEYAREQS